MTDRDRVNHLDAENRFLLGEKNKWFAQAKSFERQLAQAKAAQAEAHALVAELYRAYHALGGEGVPFGTRLQRLRPRQAKRADTPERQAFDASVNPALEGFLQEMRLKLWANRHKGNREGWIDDDSLDLFGHLEEEVKELGQALDRWPANSRRIIREAADVANMAMMIADQFAQPEVDL